jgi:hypothetical protein
MKTITNSRDSSESLVRIYFLGFPFLSLVDFCHCQLLIGCRKKSAKMHMSFLAFGPFSESQAAFGKFVRFIGGSEQSSMNRVSGKMFRNNYCLYLAITYSYIFFTTRCNPKFKNHIGTSKIIYFLHNFRTFALSIFCWNAKYMKFQLFFFWQVLYQKKIDREILWSQSREDGTEKKRH